jgi:hypothetical protein
VNKHRRHLPPLTLNAEATTANGGLPVYTREPVTTTGKPLLPRPEGYVAKAKQPPLLRRTEAGVVIDRTGKPVSPQFTPRLPRPEREPLKPRQPPRLRRREDGVVIDRTGNPVVPKRLSPLLRRRADGAVIGRDGEPLKVRKSAPPLPKVKNSDSLRQESELVAGPTLMQHRLLDAAAEIYGSEPEDRAYLHVVLAQCGLPYRPPSPEMRDYIRTNGNATLILTSGHLVHPKTQQPVLQGIPYGARPRLLLIHLCTQAKLKKSPEVKIENSMSAFMQELGMRVTGGENGSIKRFKEQLNRLAATRMQLLIADDAKASMRNLSSPIQQYDVWFPKDPAQKILWPTTITMSVEFFNSLMADGALPLDPRAIKGLQRSAMALDIYTWLAHRLWRIPDHEPVPISWFALRRQFGPDYDEGAQGMRDFRKDFKEALAKVQIVYRDAKVSFNSNGILELRQSRPPVPPTVITVR